MSELPKTSEEEFPLVFIPEKNPRINITIGELIDHVAHEATKKVLKNLKNERLP